MHKGLTLPLICVDRADDGEAREKTKFWGRQSLPKGEGGQSEPTTRERQLPSKQSSRICNLFKSPALRCILASQINVKMQDRDKLTQGIFHALPHSKKFWICEKLILKKGGTRVAELGSLSSEAKMAKKFFVKRVFTISRQMRRFWA